MGIDNITPRTIATAAPAAAQALTAKGFGRRATAWVPDVPSNISYPSGRALATRDAPIMPPAPPMFSITTD